MNENVKVLLNSIFEKYDPPVKYLSYTGESKTYAIYQVVTNSSALHSDDEVTASRVTIDIDIYSYSDYISFESSIKQTMKDNDFLWTDDPIDEQDKETKQFHKTMTFVIERMV